MTATQSAAVDQLMSILLALVDGYANGLNAAYLRVRAGRGITPQVIQQFRMDGTLAVLRLGEQVQAVTASLINPEKASAEIAIQRSRFMDALRRIALDQLDALVRNLIGHHQRLAHALTQPAGTIGLILQNALSYPVSVSGFKPLVRDMAQVLAVQDA